MANAPQIDLHTQVPLGNLIEPNRSQKSMLLDKLADKHKLKCSHNSNAAGQT